MEEPDLKSEPCIVSKRTGFKAGDELKTGFQTKIKIIMKGHSLDPRLLGFAREMRHQPNSPEAFMWNVLRNRRSANLKFRRQQVIEPYIVDFYCAQIGLVIEIDSLQHSTAKALAYDARRTANLNAQGLQVVRYQNRDVMQQAEMVLAQLWELVQKHLTQL